MKKRGTRVCRQLLFSAAFHHITRARSSCLCPCRLPPLPPRILERPRSSFPSIFALWPLSTLVLPSILPPPPPHSDSESVSREGVSECAHCQVVFGKHAAFRLPLPESETLLEGRASPDPPRTRGPEFNDWVQNQHTRLQVSNLHF